MANLATRIDSYLIVAETFLESTFGDLRSSRWQLYQLANLDWSL
jgi:hypothetical protein